MQLENMKSKGISGAVLRVAAMATMLTDHIGWNFIENHMTLTWIGRIAFPIYAFLLAEGFLIIHKSNDRLKKHFAMLVMLVFVSELGYDLMDYNLRFADYLNSQSCMITLLMGYMGMMATEWFASSEMSAKETAKRKNVIVLGCFYVLLGCFNYMIKGNFNLVGPWMVIAFYWYIRRSKEAAKAGNSWPWAKKFMVIMSIFICYLPIYFWVRSGFGDAARWWQEVVEYAPWILGHVVSGLIISLYNGELGYREKWFRKLYLSFYPLHMYAIGIICILIRN